MLTRWRAMFRRGIVGLIVAVCCAIAQAQTTTQVEVTRNVNLRPDPSSTNKAIELLHPPERLELVEPNAQNGYYHVRAAEGEEGWIWSKSVRLIQNVAPPETLIAATVAASSPASHISKDWAKGTPTETTFQGAEGPCPFDGNGFDPNQYTLKNRSDSPTSYHDVQWSAIDQLDYPGKSDQNYAPTHRKDWQPAQLAIIQPFEGIPVRVVGYVVAIKPQNGSSGEGTNCKFNQLGDVDTHIALVEKAGNAEAKSIVIEWTPRFLKAHPNWTRDKLLPWLDVDQPVRVSGWLMVDPDHVNHLRKYRDTLWEIHPITKFEVFQNGHFVDMDQLH